MNRIPVRARHALAVACALLLAACGSDGGAAATAGGAQDAFPGPGAGSSQAFPEAHAAQPAGYADPYAAQDRYGGAGPDMHADGMSQQIGQGQVPQPGQQELERRYPEGESQAQRDHQSIIDSIRSENGLR